MKKIEAKRREQKKKTERTDLKVTKKTFIIR
jgi:hypothetical protein